MAGQIYSNNRKLFLSGWLKANCPAAYSDSLKFQKFLFPYESFSKADGKCTCQ